MSDSTTRPEGPNPSGLCMCGCGQRTPIATYTHARDQRVKGTPIRYINGHSSRSDHYYPIKAGMRFGLLTAMADEYPTKGEARVQVQCECGNVKTVTGSALRGAGGTRSCGVCTRRRASTRHGMKGTPEYALWRGVRVRANKKNIPFDLKPTDIHIPSICPVFGTPMMKIGGVRTDASPSIDRIDNSLGYTASNIAVISWRANCLKNSGTAAEHEAIAQWMRARLGGTRD